jgi:DNA-binding beta-propeller fold protein YncE
VANNGDSSLSVIDSNSNTVIETVAGVTSANGVAYDPTHNMIWVTNNLSDRVTPIQVNDSATSFTPLTPINVGDEPWGVAYDPIHDYVYVANRSGPSVTVINATSPTVTTTLSGSFSQPSHIAVNPMTGKAYVTNFANHSVTVLDGASVSSVVDLNVGDPSTQPYGVAVDEIRNLVYVATVDSHRVVVIGTLAGNPDRVLGWSTFHRGFGDPARPVPMRVIAVNPNIGPAGNGGHVWTTTSTSYGSEANQALLIPKGWGGYFDYPLPREVGADPSEGIALDRTTNRVYVSSGASPGTVTVLGDDTDPCVIPFVAEDGIGFEVFTVE